MSSKTKSASPDGLALLIQDFIQGHMALNGIPDIFITGAGCTEAQYRAHGRAVGKFITALQEQRKVSAASFRGALGCRKFFRALLRHLRSPKVREVYWTERSHAKGVDLKSQRRKEDMSIPAVGRESSGAAAALMDTLEQNLEAQIARFEPLIRAARRRGLIGAATKAE